ncbi:MAG: glycerol-3-phosphate responsive antiterminator [Sphaerochaetaceae bacterium]|nr:glycerol-3-phosphate responsive antiterminator [Sphaerochaetaceae bacterium]
MSNNDIREIFLDSPIIAAIKDDDLLNKAVMSDCDVVFVLYGTICNIDKIVDKIKENNKIAIVHADLIQGLGNRDIAVDFIKEHTRADGIISTKQNLVRRAKDLNMIAGERTFAVDSMAMNTIKNHINTLKPDFLEIMPGLVTKIISQISSISRVPVVAGGLISDKQDILSALDAGACAISTTRSELWAL